MTYTLVEREKLGPNAYRVSAVIATSEEQEPLFNVMQRFVKGSPCYGPHGTHTLVLLAVTS